MPKRVEVYLDPDCKKDETHERDAHNAINLAYAIAISSGPLDREYETQKRFGCDAAYSGSDEGAAAFADRINKIHGMRARIVDRDSS
jgi:hypothetical protein